MPSLCRAGSVCHVADPLLASILPYIYRSVNVFLLLSLYESVMRLGGRGPVLNRYDIFKSKRYKALYLVYIMKLEGVNL